MGLRRLVGAAVLTVLATAAPQTSLAAPGPAVLPSVTTVTAANPPSATTVTVPLRRSWRVANVRQVRVRASRMACAITAFSRRADRTGRRITVRCVPDTPVTVASEFPLVVSVRGHRHQRRHMSVHVDPSPGAAYHEAGPVPSGTSPTAPVAREPTPVDVGPPPVPVAKKAKSVPLTKFGAVGDGVTDDTDAIKAALAALRPGQTLFVPPGGTFVHSDVVQVRTPGVRLSGGGTFLATDEQASQFGLFADDIRVDNVTFRVASTTRRWASFEKMKLLLGPYDGIVVNSVTIDGSAAAGVMVSGASGFTLSHVTVRNTRADGIHMTNGANNGLVSDADVAGTGDDGVAVVSYRADGVVCHDLKILSPRFGGQTWGRAFTVVGGRDVVFRDIRAENSNGASVYIAAEGEYDTYGVSRILVDGGSIINANVNPQVDHGAIMIYNSTGPEQVDTVVLKNLTVDGTRAGATPVHLATERVDGESRILLLDISFSGSHPGLVTSTAAPGSLDLIGLFLNGSAVPDVVRWS